MAAEVVVPMKFEVPVGERAVRLRCERRASWIQRKIGGVPGASAELLAIHFDRNDASRIPVAI